jgi:hypothetical protein
MVGDPGAIAALAFPLAMTGGVLLADPLLRQSLKSGLAERNLRPEPVTAVPDPVAGALRLAAQLRARSTRGHEGRQGLP